MAKQTQKLFPDQFDDEEVLFTFRKHPIVMRTGLLLGMLGPIVGVMPTAIKPDLGFDWFYSGLGIGLLLGFLLFAPSLIAWYFSIFIVTDQRLIQITQKGLFHRSIVDLSLSQIQSINYEVKGIQATLLGYGTIIVQTFMGDLVIHDVHHPSKIYNELGQVLRDMNITPARPNVVDDTGEIDEEN